MLARLFDGAPDAFRRIAHFTVFDTSFPNPPRDFLSLSLLCHASHRILTLNSAQLYLHIFSATFDILGPLCRLGLPIVRDNAKHELQRRFTVLKIFRGSDFDHPRLTEALWIAYTMYDDADRSQKNFKALAASGLHGFLDTFIRTRLYRRSENNNGWPIPSERNSLALALLWLSTSQRSIDRESEDQREEMERLLKPFVFAAFRYPIFGTPESCFDASTVINQSSTSSAHGPYPPTPLAPCNVTYFGQATRAIMVPSVSLYSALSFFVRQEARTPQIPAYLYPEHRKGVFEGPTFGDIKYFAENCCTHFANFPGIDIGALGRFKALSASSYTTPPPEPPAYRLGTLTGSWQGSYMLSYLEDYTQWLTTLKAPPELHTLGRRPLFMSLQEHFTRDLASMIPVVSASAGTTDAWLPAGFQWVRQENGIEVFDEQGTFRTFYETLQHGSGSNPETGQVADVIITGKVAPQHAAAWGERRIFGRIRLSDGLIVLSSEALNGDGTTIIRGYALTVTSSQNFVGRFKGVSSGNHPSIWESAFSLCEVRESSLVIMGD